MISLFTVLVIYRKGQEGGKESHSMICRKYIKGNLEFGMIKKCNMSFKCKLCLVCCKVRFPQSCNHIPYMICTRRTEGKGNVLLMQFIPPTE